MRNQHEETGSATITVVGLCSAGILLLGFVLLWAFASLQYMQALRAADLAAVAAADAHRGLTSYEPCAIAQELVLANGATMETCVLGQDQASVTVTVGSFHAQSRAGAAYLSP